MDLCTASKQKGRGLKVRAPLPLTPEHLYYTHSRGKFRRTITAAAIPLAARRPALNSGQKPAMKDFHFKDEGRLSFEE